MNLDANRPYPKLIKFFLTRIGNSTVNGPRCVQELRISANTNSFDQMFSDYVYTREDKRLEIVTDLFLFQ